MYLISAYNCQVVTDRTQQLEIIRSIHAGIGSTLQSQSTGGHHGVNKTREKITKRFYWPRVSEDVRDYIRACDACQRAKQINLQKTKSQLKNVTIPNKLFSQIAIDLMGMVPVDGMKYILTIQDYFSKWIELVPIPDKSATTVAAELFKFFSRYGCADVVISDRGSEFNNELGEELYKRMGVQHRVTSAYHPQVRKMSITKYVIINISVIITIYKINL